jgi:hypothetical protein
MKETGREFNFYLPQCSIGVTNNVLLMSKTDLQTIKMVINQHRQVINKPAYKTIVSLIKHNNQTQQDVK